MRTVYVCSPFRAETKEGLDRNLSYARELTRQVLLRGDCPITPHLYMTQCLDEYNPHEREIGLAAGRDILKKCDEMYVGIRYGVSKGMEKEIEEAERLGIPFQRAE